ncbi:hypothetical protein OROMI_008807 [Orobanche minor]
MAEAVMCKPFFEELTDDDSTFSTGSPVLKKAKVCTDSPSSVEERDWFKQGDAMKMKTKAMILKVMKMRLLCRYEFASRCPFCVITPIFFKDDDTRAPELAKRTVGITVDRYNADPQFLLSWSSLKL